MIWLVLLAGAAVGIVTAAMAMFSANVVAEVYRMGGADSQLIRALNAVIGTIAALVLFAAIGPGIIGAVVISLVCAFALPVCGVAVVGLFTGINYVTSSASRKVASAIREWHERRRIAKEERRARRADEE